MRPRGKGITESVQPRLMSVPLPVFWLLSALGTSNGFDWLRFFSRPRVGNPPQLSLPAAVMTSPARRQLASFGRMAHRGGMNGRVGARPRVQNEANRGDMGQSGAAMQNEANSLARGSVLTDARGRVYVSSPALGGVENEANLGAGALWR